MSLPPVALWVGVLGGYNAQQVDQLRQDQTLTEFVTATNVIPDPAGSLVTSPGFSNVRSSAISGTPAITGMFSFGDVASEFILWGSNGKPHRDNANPPGAITGGTDFTSGSTTLVRGDVGGAAGSEVLVCVSNARNVPQQITKAIVRSDLGGTPPRGVDFHVWGRRPWMFSPSDGSTVYGSFACFGSLDDSAATWANPYTTNFLNFGRPGQAVYTLGGQKYKDHLMAFTEDSVFPIYQTPNAVLPFAFQDDILDEDGGGPVNIHSVVVAAGRLYWLSRNFDVKVMAGMAIRSIGYPVQPFLRGLNDARRQYAFGGFEPQYRMVWWAVSDGADSTNLDALGVQVDTHQFYTRTISRNAFANRIVSGEMRLIGGDYAGLFYNEFDSSTTGDLANSASAIGATITTPRHHWGLPGIVKKVPYVAVEVDPIGTETITVTGNYDDETAFTSIATTIVVSGTDTMTAVIPTPRPYKRIQLSFTNATSGERVRLLRYGVPRPQAMSVRA